MSRDEKRSFLVKELREICQEIDAASFPEDGEELPRSLTRDVKKRLSDLIRFLDEGDRTESEGERLPHEYRQALELAQLESEEQVRRVYALFVDHFGGFEQRISANEAEYLKAWLDESPNELVYLAILKAVNRNRISLAYVDRILLNWSRQNRRTLSQVIAEEEEYARRKGRKGAYGRSRRRFTDESLAEYPRESVDYGKL